MCIRDSACAAPELLEAERELVMEALHQDTTCHFGKYTPLRADAYVILHAMETSAKSAKESKEYWLRHPRSMTLTSPPRCGCFVFTLWGTLP